MSRCFPYPPPGYSLNNARNWALIESIKLQKESEKAKAERKKEMKKEKKEKNREKKDKAKLNEREINHDEKAYKGGKSHRGLEKGYVERRKEDKAEQLERSGLTEEHGQPVRLQNPSNSSDSTQNSNKRKRDPSPSNGCRSHGNIIRIRLPLQKHKELDVSVGRDGVCTTSGRAELPIKEPHLAGGKERLGLISGTTESHANPSIGVAAGASRVDLSTSRRIDHVVKELPSRCGKEPTSTSGSTETIGQDGVQISRGTTSFKKRTRKLESLYKDLIENCVPQAPQTDLPDFEDDQDWLFGGKHQGRHVEKRFKAGNDLLPCGPSILRPCAQYVPEADIYALPYTVPY